MDSYDNYAKAISEYAIQHTDLIVAFDEDCDSKTIIPKRVGSVTLVTFNGKEYLITCRHVITHKRWLFSGAGKGTGQTINENEALKCRSLKVVSESTDCDIAILSGYPDDPFGSGQAIREASLTVLRPDRIRLCMSRKQKHSLCGFAASSGVLNPQGNKTTCDFEQWFYVSMSK